MNCVRSLIFALLLCLSFTTGSWAEPLRFAYQNRIGDAVSIVAVEKKLFAAVGLQITPLLFNNGPACSEALVTGSVDIATMGDTAALLAVSRTSDLRIIGSHGAGEQRHRIMVSLNSPIRTAQDLKGQRVAVKKGTSTHGGFLAFLARHRMSPADLKIMDLDPGLMPEALSAGSIDAFVASEPTPTQAELRGARPLSDLSGLGNAYPLMLLAKSTTIHRRDGEIRRFMQALEKAARYIAQHPAETTAILAKETGLPVSAIPAVMKRHIYRVQLDGATITSLEKIGQFLKEQGKIQQIPDLASILDRRYLPQRPAQRGKQ